MTSKEECREIQNDIQDYLDEKLTPEKSAEIENHLNTCVECQQEYQSWKTLFQQLNSFPAEQLSPDFTSRVMQKISQEKPTPEKSLWEKVHRILTMPRVSLKWAAAFGMVLVALVMGYSVYFSPVQPICPNNLAEITFTLQADASQVKSIAVVGDFNDWDPHLNPLTDDNGDGVWSATLKLEPGRYEYMFILNGDKWVPDPQALRYVRDGFGNKNAVIEINGCS